MPLLAAAQPAMLAAALTFATAFPILAPEKTQVARGAIEPTSGGIYPAVATDGTNFLVVSGAYAMLVDSDGNPLLQTSVVIPYFFKAAAIASSGNTYLIAPGGGKAVLLDKAGSLQKIIDLGPVAQVGNHDVAWDGSHYVVVQQTEPQVGHPGNLIRYTATPISESGKVLGDAIEVAGSRVAARDGVVVVERDADDVIAGDDGFLIVWRSPENTQVIGRHLDRSGAPDGDPFVIATGPAAGGGPPRGAWTGGDYAVVLPFPPPARIVHVTRSGPSAPPVAIGHFQAYSSDIAWNGDSLLFTWWNQVFSLGDNFPSGSSTRAGRIENDLLVTTHVVHRQHNHQTNPLLATTGAGVFAAWSESGGFEDERWTRVAGSFVSASGSGPRIPIASAGELITTAGGPSSALVIDFERELRAIAVMPNGSLSAVSLAQERTPSIAATWTGRDYLVAWARQGDRTGSINTLRISQNGTALEAAPRHIADTFKTGSLAVASSGTSALIVYFDAVNGPLRGSLVNDTITPVDMITDAGDLHSDINVTSDGSGYLVTWYDTGAGKIRGRPVGSDGRFDGNVRNYGDGPAQRLFTFWTGENYLLVWTSGRDLWATRVSPAGDLIDVHPHFIGTLDSPALSMTQFGPSQLVILTSAGTVSLDERLILNYALAPRQRPAKHR